MIRKQIEHLTANTQETVAECFWRFCKYPALTMVVDEQEKYYGIVTKRDYELIDIRGGGRSFKMLQIEMLR